MQINGAKKRWFAWGAALWWLCFPGLSVSGQRIFTVDGIPLSFEDISASVDVYYRSMRLNRALNEWNVETLVSNKTTQAITGRLLFLVESSAGISGVLQPDGIDNGQPFIDLSSRLNDNLLAPSSLSRSVTLRLGYTTGGVPRLVSRIFLGASPAASSLGLTRSLDDVGHPLASVQVSESGPGGTVVRQTDPSLGIVTLGQGTGDYVWQFSAPGYLPVWRRQSLRGNAVTLIPNPRLVPRRNPVTVMPVGGVVSNALDTIRLTFGAGSFSQPTPVTLTPLTAQTLPGLLPLGWSPLQACAIEWDGTLAGSAQLRWFPWGRIEFAETAVFAQWSATEARWEVVQSAPGNIEGPLTFALSSPRTFALVIADSGAYAPSGVVPGQPLPAAILSVTDISKLSARGAVATASSVASRTP